MLSCQLNIPFINQKDAIVAYNSLRVDAEPRKETAKTLNVEQNVLHVCLTAPEARLLRVAVGSFLDHLILVVETIKEFGEF